MRKIILSSMTSLDGYFAARGEGWDTIAWHRADDEWDAYSVELLDSADALLFGRRTYLGFADYWPTAEGEVAKRLNAAQKIVASRSLEGAVWGPARIVRDLPDEIARIKEEPGGDIVLFGSGEIASALTRHRLIDEYRVAVNPVVLGRGVPLLEAAPEPLDLKLIDTRTFASGIVVLRYALDTKSGEA